MKPMTLMAFNAIHWDCVCFFALIKGGSHSPLTKPFTKWVNKNPTCLKVMMVPY